MILHTENIILRPDLQPTITSKKFLKTHSKAFKQAVKTHTHPTTQSHAISLLSVNNVIQDKRPVPLSAAV